MPIFRRCGLLHERTIADALQDALESALKMTLLPPVMEEAARVRPEAAGLPVSAHQIPALLDGEQDVWLASCGGFHASPFGQPRAYRPHSGDAWTVRMR